MTNLRARIDTAFERLGHFVFRRRFLTLSVMILIMAAFFSQLPKLQTDTSNKSYFHKDDPTVLDYAAFLNQFGREEFVIIAITPPEVFDRAFLEKLTAFHDAIEDEVPYLDDVTSLVNIRETRGEGDELIVDDLLETLPDSPEAMAALRERVLASQLYRNFLISESGQMTTVVLETLAYSPEAEEDDLLAAFGDEGDVDDLFADATSEDPADIGAADAGAADGGAMGIGGGQQPREPLTVEENAAVVQAVEAVVARFNGPDFPIHVAGGPPLNDFFQRMMQQDMGTFISAAVVTIAIFLFILFRRLSGVLMPLVVVFLSLLSTIGLMASLGVAFTIPTTILPSFLLAVGIGACVHLMTIFYRHYVANGNKEAAVVYALGHSGLPILMTSVTTSAGLFAFSTAEMAPVAHLGIFGGIGVLLALMYTLVLIPVLLAIFPVRRVPWAPWRHRRAPSERVDALLRGIADFSVGNARMIVLASAVILVLAVVGLFSLQFSMYFIKWLPTNLPLRAATDLIDGEMGGTINLEVIVDTERENGLHEPSVLEGLDELAAFAEGFENAEGNRFVSNTNSVADVLKETHRALNENRPEFYALPQDRQLIAQEMLLFENSGSDDLETVVDGQFSKARLSLIVPNRDATSYVNFVQSVEQEAERIFADDVQITVTGTLNLFAQMVFTMMRSMVQSYFIAGIVITVLMMLLISSFRLGIITIFINFTPILLTLGIVMGFNGIRLDAFTLTIGSIALGLAVDDTIHFFHNFRRYYGIHQDVQKAVRETLLTTGRAMLFTTLVLVTGFWLFMLATLNNVIQFGLLTGLTILFALIADFVLAPALMELVSKTRHGRVVMARWAAG